MNKRKIFLELEKILNNNQFISDIWLYGSISDRVSDLDLLIIYKNNPKKIFFPKLIKKMILDGTVIYIPIKYSYDVFLFEDLSIFSIRYKKKITRKLSKQLSKFRSLTSFLERYYERRCKLLTTRSITDKSLRLIKSIIFSYINFEDYFVKSNSKKTSLNTLLTYKKIREKYCSNNLSKKKLKDYLNKFKENDRNFYDKSINELNQKFPSRKNEFINYRFNKNTKYSFVVKKNYITVPYILGYIYKFYSLCNFSISGKIKYDLKSNIKLNLRNKLLHNYLKKKINFINASYKDLKKNEFKNGLYRLTWYLSE